MIGTTVGALTENLNRIRVPLSGIVRRQRPGPYRYFGAQGVIDYIDEYLFDGEYLLVAEDGENLRSRKQPIALLVSGKFWVNNHAHVLKVDETVANSTFLLHAINQANLSAYVTGAAQPKLTKANLARVPIPPIGKTEQDRIGAVLDAFDGLIAVNARRIELLQNLARSLYREWFVRLRFPGHGTGVGACAPARGWNQARLGDVVMVNELTAKRNELPDPLEYLDISSVGERRIDGTTVVSPEVAPGRARRRIRDADTVWAMVRPNRRAHAIVHDPPENMIASTGLAVLTARAIPSSFLFEFTSSQEFTDYLVGRATGAAYPAVRPDDFKGAPIVVPPNELLAAFDRAASPALRLASNLQATNRALARTRDLLLPRLLTGRLDLTEIDLAAPLPNEAA